MKTSTALIALAAAFTTTTTTTTTTAAPTPEKAEHAAALQKRVIDPITAGIISGAAVTAVVGTASGVAVGQINSLLPALGTWEKVREEFTQKTVAEMWNKRPGDEYAAICYNMDYTVSKPDQVSELASVEVRSGPLNADYDCFFLKGPDARFTPNGDGGFINYAAQHNDAYCTYDDASGEIYCK